MLVKKLKLTDNFESTEFNIKFSVPHLLIIAIIVISAVILIQEIPNFCSHIYLYFQEKSLTHGMTQPRISYSVISGVKILLVCLLFGERNRIVKLISKEKEPNGNL